MFSSGVKAFSRTLFVLTKLYLLVRCIRDKEFTPHSSSFNTPSRAGPFPSVWIPPWRIPVCQFFLCFFDPPSPFSGFFYQPLSWSTWWLHFVHQCSRGTVVTSCDTTAVPFDELLKFVPLVTLCSLVFPVPHICCHLVGFYFYLYSMCSAFIAPSPYRQQRQMFTVQGKQFINAFRQ